MEQENVLRNRECNIRRDSFSRTSKPSYVSDGSTVGSKTALFAQNPAIRKKVPHRHKRFLAVRPLIRVKVRLEPRRRARARTA